MIYLNKLFHYIILYAQNYPLNSGLFLLFFLELFFICTILNYKIVFKDLKIYKFYLNKIYIILYFLFFIILICIIRYLRWGYTLDLLVIYEKLRNLFIILPIIVTIDLILIIIIILLLLNVVKKFFYIELLKLFIYYYHEMRLDAQKEYKKKHNNKNILYMTPLDYPLLVQFYNKLKFQLNFQRIIDRLVFSLIIEPYCKAFNKKSFKYFYKNIICKVLFYMPQCILIILFFYDCWFNHLKIHLIFYYLPIYFILHIWKSLNCFIDNTNSLLNNILYEIYYEDNVVYIGITEEELHHLELYEKRNCRCISMDIYDDDINVQQEKRELVQSFGLVFMQNRRFIRRLNTNIYDNLDTGESYEIKDKE